MVMSWMSSGGCHLVVVVLRSLALRWRRQRSEQYLTSSQTSAHFLRQVNGLWQTTQVFCGRWDFLTPRMIKNPG